METVEDAGVKTPSSLASSPRGSMDDWEEPPTFTRRGQSKKAAVSPLQKGPDFELLRLQDAWTSARHMRGNADNLHAVLGIVRTHMGAVQRQLAAAKLDITRERQAADIRVMEKDCDIRFLQSEAEAYKLACAARASALDAMQGTVEAVQQEQQIALEEKTAAAAALREVEAALTSSQRQLESLQELANTLQAELHESHATIASLRENQSTGDALAPQLEAAQRDAATAAEQLMDACEENARLSEALADLELQAESWDAHMEQWRTRENELHGKVQNLTTENTELRAELDIAHEKVARLQRLSDSIPGIHGIQGTNTTPVLSSQLTPSKAALTRFITPQPTSVLSAAASSIPGSHHRSDLDPEDLLAVEVSRLRQHTQELEAELASAGESAPVVVALERETVTLRTENMLLRGTAERAAQEAAKAQNDMLRMQQEAADLHTQLSDVISSLAGTEVALNAPLRLTAGAGAEVSGRQENLTSSAAAAAAPSMTTTTAASVEKKAPAGIPWRGPPTPTSEVPPSAGTARAQTAESDSGSDQILAELRTAMAALDPAAPLCDTYYNNPLGSSSGNGGLVGEHSSTRLGSDDFGVGQGEPQSQRNGGQHNAAHLLESISRGIASLGQGNLVSHPTAAGETAETQTVASAAFSRSSGGAGSSILEEQLDESVHPDVFNDL